MADTPEIDVSLKSDLTTVRPPKWVAIFTVLTQAMLLAIVLIEAFRHPGITRRILTVVYCLVSAALGYHQIRRSFLLEGMPPRFQSGDWKVKVFKFFLLFYFASVFVTLIGSLTRIFAHSGSAWDYFIPIVLLNKPWMDYLLDRLPVARNRIRGGGAKIWDSMQPIHSDHWGEHGAS